jgi:predicted AAA+ superfamily ATPase
LLSNFDKENIFFYRTTVGTEIDFIVKDKDKITPIEVKFKQFLKCKNIPAISNFPSDT